MARARRTAATSRRATADAPPEPPAQIRYEESPAASGRIWAQPEGKGPSPSCCHTCVTVSSPTALDGAIEYSVGSGLMRLLLRGSRHGFVVDG